MNSRQKLILTLKYSRKENISQSLFKAKIARPTMRVFQKALDRPLSHVHKNNLIMEQILELGTLGLGTKE